FSSRSRHTSSYGDWSSDVCSSDLGRTRCRMVDRGVERGQPRRTDKPVVERDRDGTQDVAKPRRWVSSLAVMWWRRRFHDISPLRSEERRVGKGVDSGVSSDINK